MYKRRLVKLSLSLILCSYVFCISASAYAQDVSSTDWAFGGHTKYQFIHTRVPQDSVFHQINGDSLQDHSLVARLKVSARRERVDFNTHIQFITVHSDSLFGFRELPLMIYPGQGVINDDRRWFDLTHEFNNEGKNAKFKRDDG